jgi:hypothetical protein
MAWSYANPGAGPGPMPYLSITLSIPQRPYDIVTRHWNRIVKEAMRKALDRHHKTRIPLHFKQEARHRYRYKERGIKYRAWKRKKYHSTRDLVKTGASERRMRNEKQIIIGGAAEGGKKPIEGKLRLKFNFTQTASFKASQKKRFIKTERGWYDNSKIRGGVTIADMKREIQAFTPEERRQFADDFWGFVWQGYQSYQTKRKRIKLGRNPLSPLGGSYAA